MMDILIIDDNASHLLMLTTFLETLGYRVATAVDGQDALIQLREATERPSLIIADVAMPHMTGWEFVRAQQSDAELAAIPVVMMTALGYFDADVATESVVDYLAKPLDLAALEKVVRVYAVPRYASRVAGA
jgi:CheY-like chemotaxis protein